MFDNQGFATINGRTFMRRDVNGLPYAVASGNFSDCKETCALVDGSTLHAPLMNVRGRATWTVSVPVDPATMRRYACDAESEIAYVSDDSPYWIARKGKGRFDVYKTGATHSTRVAQCSSSADPARAFSWAMSELIRRENADAFGSAAA